MVSGQYRDSPTKASPELERLAQQGRAARENASDSASKDAEVAGDHHLREALVPLYGSPRTLIAKSVAATLMAIAGLLIAFNKSVHPAFGIVAVFVAFFALFGASVLTPRASDGALEEERTWEKGLPFALEGYFDVLSATPRESGGLKAYITWHSDTAEVDEKLLADAFAGADADATLEEAEEGGPIFVSGAISGRTGGSINHRPILRNHHYPEYIHTLMAKVLIPLSKSHRIEHVRLEAV